MGERFAAQSVIEELLRQQDGRPVQSAFARLFGVSPLGTDSVSWYLGALGELEVGRVLATLTPGWHAYHALPIGTSGTDIDHLVVGPGGIVTINTKNHRGKTIWVAGTTFMVSGHKVPYIRNAAYEADRVAKLLQKRMPGLSPVLAAVALISPKSLTIKIRPARVKVVTSVRPRRWLVKLPVVLSPTAVVAVATVIDEPATWPPQALPPVENARGRFDALDRQVRSARKRRIGWAGALGVCLVVVTLVVGPHLATAITAFISAVAS